MRSNPKFAAPQSGAVLIVSLLLLLVMTVLALTASQTTRLQERMAGNARDLDLAFQASEAGLRAAEIRIDNTVAINAGQNDECAGAEDIQDCEVAARDSPAALDGDYARKTVAWWGDNAFAFGDPLAQIDVRPHYYTELWAKVKDSQRAPGSGGPQSGTAYYVNVSRSQGATETAVTLVESTFAVRYTLPGSD
jgi:type IV pilus assembly protein PilX